MKCNALFLTSCLLGQSAMALNVYRPGGSHNHVVVSSNGTAPFLTGTGASSGFAKPTSKKCNSTRPTGSKSATALPVSVTSSSTKKPCTGKKSLTTLAPAQSSVAAISADPSTVTYTNFVSGTVYETVTATITPSPSASSSAGVLTSLNINVPSSISSIAAPSTASASASASKSKCKSTAGPPYPTTIVTKTTGNVASTGFPAPSASAPSASASGGIVKEYYQCGGSQYNGPTSCVEGSVCKFWSEYYSQCVDAKFA